MEQDILVSVVVITYNSEKYILETLESIKTQSYKNLELIISDDCSKDDTVMICRDWLDKEGERFIRTKLITSPCNTGIPANMNRGYTEARGVWIKGIAGDDILLPTCIDDLMSISEGNSVLTGISQSFYVNELGKRVLTREYPTTIKCSFFHLPSEKQYKRLLVNSFNFAPGSFIRKELFLILGGYDEHFRYLEDLPFWLKCTANGFRIVLLNKPVVLYRTQHDSMVFQRKCSYNVLFYKCLFSFRKNIVFSQVPWYNILFWEKELLDRAVFYFVVYVCHNRNNRFTRLVKSVSAYFYFQSYWNWLKKHLL